MKEKIWGTPILQEPEDSGGIKLRISDISSSDSCQNGHAITRSASTVPNRKYYKGTKLTQPTLHLK